MSGREYDLMMMLVMMMLVHRREISFIPDIKMMKPNSKTSQDDVASQAATSNSLQAPFLDMDGKAHNDDVDDNVGDDEDDDEAQARTKPPQPD